MIGDSRLISVYDLRAVVDDDPVFGLEALAILKRDHVDQFSTYTPATSASGLLDKWLDRGELRCFDDRGTQVDTRRSVTLYPDERGDYSMALEVVERGWLVPRVDFVLLAERYGMTVPRALIGTAGPDIELAENEFGFTVLGAARALHEQFCVDESKWRDSIMDAVRQGQLEVRDPRDGAVEAPDRLLDVWWRIDVADFNRWLATVKRVKFQLQKATQNVSLQSESAREGETGAAAVGCNPAEVWQAEARRVATQLHLRDVANGSYSSLSDISERVAADMWDRGIEGPRGKLTRGNIMREALQGGRWRRSG